MLSFLGQIADLAWTKDIVLMLLGGVIGTWFSVILPRMYSRYSVRYWEKIRTRRLKILKSSSLREWVENYYSKRGLRNQLFCCRIGCIDLRIPIITKPSWCRNISIDKFPVVEVIDSVVSDFPVNERPLKLREAIGQRIFNDMALYVDRVEENSEAIKIISRRCQYFSLASNLIILEEELIRAAAARFQWLGRTPVRNGALASVEIASQFSLRPLSLGCATVMRFKTDEGDKILIHRRSTEVITSAGTFAVMPCFGLEPIDYGVQKGRNDDVLLLNFVKEFCEEIYGLDNLISGSRSRRAGDWIRQLPEAVMLLEAFDSGDASIEFLGLGIDATNGTTVIALEVIIQEKRLVEKIEKSISGNWEVEERSSDQMVIELISVNDIRFEQWLKGDEFSYPSAFALSLALS